MVVHNEPLSVKLNQPIKVLVLAERLATISGVLQDVVGISIMGGRSFGVVHSFFSSYERMVEDVVVYSTTIFAGARVGRYVGMVNKGFRSRPGRKAIKVKHLISLSALSVAKVSPTVALVSGAMESSYNEGQKVGTNKEVKKCYLTLCRQSCVLTCTLCRLRFET